MINIPCRLFGDTGGGSLIEHITVFDLNQPTEVGAESAAPRASDVQYQRMSQNFRRRRGRPPRTVLVSSGRKLLDRARTVIRYVLALLNKPFLDDTVETWQCCFRSDCLTLK